MPRICKPGKEVPKEGSHAMAQPEDDYDADREQGFSTIQLHHGQVLDEANRSRATPIHQTTSYVFKDSDHGAKLFGLQELGHIYTRMNNPTNFVQEYRVAKLEGSPCSLDGAFPSALSTCSGMSAQLNVMTTLVRTGEWVISTSDLYGGTMTQFEHSFARMGINVKLINGNDLGELKKAFKELGADNVKAVYYETLGNPSLIIPDFEAISEICKANHTPFVVDNTFGMVGYVCRPFKFGADIVVESMTKWGGGHGTTVGGMIIDNHSFDWGVKKADGTSKYPNLNEPAPAYHGLNFNAVFGPEGPFKVNMAFIFNIRVVALRDLGAAQSPMSSFFILQGLETLSLRAKAHCENANRLAQWLQERPEVKEVIHPSLANHPSHERAKQYFRPGLFGSVLNFRAKGGAAAAKKFVDACKLASNLANVGDAKTLIIHPYSTTHSQLSAEEMVAAGVFEDMVRVSAGFEEFADIAQDFDQAFKA